MVSSLISAFDRAWALLKTDMRLPTPWDVPQYTDPHANLAFYGSMNPDWRRHWDPHPTFPSGPEGETAFAQSIRDELAVRRRELVLPPKRDYEIGDFSDALREGVKGAYFGGESRMGIEPLAYELERASLVEALHDAGIHDKRSIENILDEEASVHAYGTIRLDERGRRLSSERPAWQIRDLEREY